MVYKLPKEAIADNELEATQLSSNLVNSFVPIGGIIMWSGTIAEAEALTNWKICDGQNGTPDLRDRFVLGVGSSTATSTASVDDTGGNNSITLTEGQMPSHNHNITDNGHSHTINNHTHPSGTLSGSNTHSHGIPRGSGGSQADTSPYIPSPVVEQIGTSFPTDDATISISISGNTGNPSNRGTSSESTGITSQTQGSDESIDIRSQFLALCYIIRVT